MSGWSPEQARRISTPEEVRVVTRRRDGSLRRPRTIWIVREGDRVFIRSTNGRDAQWFRGALSTGTGRLIAGSATVEVAFTEVGDESSLSAADSGYRSKYSRYPAIVDHLVDDGPRAATLEVAPLTPLAATPTADPGRQPAPPGSTALPRVPSRRLA